ncbi:KxYKxGKxW signal peptide domain-containing protein [Collimonas humicola]
MWKSGKPWITASSARSTATMR